MFTLLELEIYFRIMLQVLRGLTYHIKVKGQLSNNPSTESSLITTFSILNTASLPPNSLYPPSFGRHSSKERVDSRYELIPVSQTLKKKSPL